MLLFLEGGEGGGGGTCSALVHVGYIYLINQARGPYWENIGPRS